MNKKYIKWIFVTAMMCLICFAFLGAAPDPESATVEALLEKRADVMESVLLEKISYEEGTEMLRSIEADKLYKDDLKSLQMYQSAEIDMETDMKVIRLQKTGQIYDKLTYKGEIFWRYTGERGVFTHKDEYHIGIWENDGIYRLISFEII